MNKINDFDYPVSKVTIATRLRIQTCTNFANASVDPCSYYLLYGLT